MQFKIGRPSAVAVETAPDVAQPEAPLEPVSSPSVDDGPNEEPVEAVEVTKTTTLMELESNAFTMAPGSGVLLPQVHADKVGEYLNDIETAKLKAIDKDKDVVMMKIAGGVKPYIKKSGWRKIAGVFGISDRIVRIQRADLKTEDGVPYFVWYVLVEARQTQSGRSEEGIGAASSMERKFAHVEHDCITLAHTRAKNRAISDLVGAGEVSAEELESEET